MLAILSHVPTKELVSHFPKDNTVADVLLATMVITANI
jgi:hypothetical protein